MHIETSSKAKKSAHEPTGQATMKISKSNVTYLNVLLLYEKMKTRKNARTYPIAHIHTHPSIHERKKKKLICQIVERAKGSKLQSKNTVKFAN